MRSTIIGLNIYTRWTLEQIGAEKKINKTSRQKITKDMED